MTLLDAFFRELDEKWAWPAEEKISLHIIGSASLMLQANYTRGTKDSDVLETGDLTPKTQQRLLGLAGKGTEIQTRHHVYIEIVSNGFPFLPQRPQWIPLPDLNAKLHSFDLYVLSVVDVVVSKLKRFNPNDISDVEAMADLGLIPHDVLVERFELAKDVFWGDARAEDLPKYVANLNRVERDVLAVAESDIELPPWI